MRVVLDTFVLFAAFATRGLCEAMFAACLHSHEIVLSDYILDELADNLTRKLKMPSSLVRDITKLLREQSDIVEPVKLPTDTFSDRNDLPVLGTVVAGKADALVTGDAQLLQLGKVDDVPILSPRAFYDRLL